DADEAPEIVSLEDADEEAKGDSTDLPDLGDDDVDIGDDDDTFLEEAEEEDDDVKDIIGVGDDDDEQSPRPPGGLCSVPRERGLILPPGGFRSRQQRWRRCRQTTSSPETVSVRQNRVWGHSSVGRALEWHSRGQGFDSPWLHQYP